MGETKKYLEALFNQHKISINNKQELFNEFIIDEENVVSVKIIQENQKRMLDKWKLKNRVDDIIQNSLLLPNGTVNKQYSYKLDFLKIGWSDIIYSEFIGLDDTGLIYDSNEELITGCPKISGDLKIKLLFRLEGENEDSVLNEKIITIIVNPDPKSLWKNIESDKSDPFWKEDNLTFSSTFLDKNIVIASKRGRSHANVGSFRDDDFAVKNFEKTGWSIIAVSDGAGSSKDSRKGSQLACELIVSYFENNFTGDSLKEFDEILFSHNELASEESAKKISHFVYDNLSKATWHVHKELEAFAIKSEKSIKDFHATLIFAIIKKYEFGYAILTFGVGDCPIGLINKDMSEVKLMNWLDVGEFGGGTRFITMPEIFQSDKFSTRFGFKLVEDFSYLMLMTDGIYDPKFVVEANLEKTEKWIDFIEDIKGKNDDGTIIELINSNLQIESQLSLWMDFWSSGNHDDRTLAIIY